VYSRSVQTFTAATIPLLVRNTGEEDIPAYAIAAIGEEANLSPGIFSRSGAGVGQGTFEIPIRKPDATAIESGSISQFLITLDDPIPAGEPGRATFSLPAWVKVASAIGQRAASVAPQAGSWELASGEGFYHVVDIKTIEGVKYALVQAAGSGGGSAEVELFNFEATSDVTGDALTASLWPPDNFYSGAATHTGISLLRHPMFEGIGDGTRGICIKSGSLYMILNAACPDEEVIPLPPEEYL